MKKLLLSLLLAVTAVVSLQAQKIAAIPLFNKVEIKLDGIPDEGFWAKVPEITSFQRYRQTGVKAPVETSVRICLDQKNLYVSMICDEPESIVTGTPGVGSAWSADGVELFFGSLKGRDWYCQVVFGLNGADYYECIRKEDVRRAVKINEKSWSAEVVIPRDKLGNIIDNELLFNMFRNRKGKGMLTIGDLRWAQEMDKFMTLKIYTPAEMIVYGPWNTQVTDSSAVICWESAGKCLASLRFREKGTEKLTDVFADIPGYAAERSKKLHTVKLRNLKPGTVYEYVIDGNDEKFSTFTTLDPEDADFSFAATADTHGRHWQLTEQFTRKHVQDADIFFHLGDTISGVIGRGSLYDALIAPICSRWQKPFYVVRGNHEGRGCAPGAFLDMLYPDGRKAYHSFLHKGVCFVILDLTDEFSIDPEFQAAQRRWLHETVNSAEFKNARFRVLLTHYAMHLRKNKLVHDLFDSLPAESQKLFDLALAGHHHCGIKILPGSNVVISDHKNYHNTAPEKVMPFLRLVNFGGTFAVSKTAGKLTVTRYDGEGKVIDTTVVPAKTGK